MSGIDYFQGHIRRERVPFISRLCSGRSLEHVDISAIKSNKKLLSSIPFRLTKAQTLLLKCMKRLLAYSRYKNVYISLNKIPQ